MTSDDERDGDGEQSQIEPTGVDATEFQRASITGKLANLINRVRSIRDSIRDLPETDSIEILLPSYKKLDRYDQRFETLMDEAIEFSALHTEAPIETQPIQAEFDRLSREARTTYLKRAKKDPSTETQDASTFSTMLNQTMLNTAFNGFNPKIRLPKLELTQFSGQIENWRTYYNLFVASVHNSPHLKEVEKFQYLLGSLSGEALDLIKSLDITTENYTVAWNLLCKRYQSTRRHIFFHYAGLLDLPEIKENKQVHSLLAKVREHTQALDALGHGTETFDGVLVTILSRKISPKLWRRLEDHRGTNTDYPKLKEIISFLEKEAAYADDLITSRKEGADVSSNSSKNASKNSSNKGGPKALVTTAKDNSQNSSKKEKNSGQNSNNNNQRTSDPCALCSEPHKLYQCLKFRDMKSHQRIELVKSRKLCERCLSGFHSTENCNKDYRCIACDGPHNTWLHPPQPTPTPEIPLNTVVNLGATSQPDTVILLATVQVEVSSPRRAVMLRGILDLGSQTTMIVTKCARALQCKIDPNLNPVNGISGYPVPVRGITQINLKHHGKVLIRDHPVTVVDKITNPTPSTPISPEVRYRLSGFPLADPDFDRVNAPVEILIGLDILPELLCGETISLGPGYPTALKTKLGYAVMGIAPAAQPAHTLLSTTNNLKFHAPRRCPLCAKNHAIARCLKFLNLSRNCKLSFLHSKKVCINCFSNQHENFACASKSSCKVCNQFHHTSLCDHVNFGGPSSVPSTPRVTQKLTAEHRKEIPATSQAREKAPNLRKKLKKSYELGVLRLRKWIRNSSQLFSGEPTKNPENSTSCKNDEITTFSVLGLKWPHSEKS